MQLFQSQTLKQLTTPRNEICFSIYIPTHPQWDKIQNDKIRFKNRLQDLKAQLKNDGYDEVTALAMLEPGEQFLNPDYKVLGKYNAADGNVVLDEPNDPENRDLVEMIIVNTLHYGGTVYTVDPQQMPNQEHMGALLRFP
ncbi:MAG: hypothetical protein U5R06_05775 [candidate division KSB1 bacterium]|nr:hypothetical protein [candidate division KSB1 bacterium]